MKKLGKYIALFLLAVIAVMSVFLFNNGFGGRIVSESSSAENTSAVTETVSQ